VERVEQRGACLRRIWRLLLHAAVHDARLRRRVHQGVLNRCANRRRRHVAAGAARLPDAAAAGGGLAVKDLRRAVAVIRSQQTARDRGAACGALLAGLRRRLRGGRGAAGPPLLVPLLEPLLEAPRLGATVPAAMVRGQAARWMQRHRSCCCMSADAACLDPRGTAAGLPRLRRSNEGSKDARSPTQKSGSVEVFTLKLQARLEPA